MDETLTHALKVFAGFFAIMNPIANTPLFLGLTEGDSSTVRHAVAWRALLLSFGIVAVFTVSGSAIFQLFGITPEAFSIAGGLLVLFIGFHMIQGRTSSVQSPTTAPTASVNIEGELSKAVSPLAMPILAGPGTIATATAFATGGWTQTITTLGAFLALCVITWFCFIYGDRLVRYLGDQGIAVVTRLMGLILASIGVQMIVGAVREVVRA